MLLSTSKGLPLRPVRRSFKSCGSSPRSNHDAIFAAENGPWHTPRLSTYSYEAATCSFGVISSTIFDGACVAAFRLAPPRVAPLCAATFGASYGSTKYLDDIAMPPPPPPLAVRFVCTACVPSGDLFVPNRAAATSCSGDIAAPAPLSTLALRGGSGVATTLVSRLRETRSGEGDDTRPARARGGDDVGDRAGTFFAFVLVGVPAFLAVRGSDDAVAAAPGAVCGRGGAASVRRSARGGGADVAGRRGGARSPWGGSETAARSAEALAAETSSAVTAAPPVNADL